jgi:hypothetical protein
MIAKKNKPGAGRPKGRNVTGSSVCLTLEQWEKLDRLRGGKTRSAWIADKIKSARLPANV